MKTLSINPYTGSLLDSQGNAPIAHTPDYDSPFVMTIDTTLGDATSTFQLPLRSGYSYNMIVDWGDGTSDTITTYNQAETDHTYSTGGIYQVSIRGLCQAWYFNNGGDKLKLTSVDNLGSIGLTAIDGGFFGCSNMTSFADDNLSWTSNCTTFLQAWRDCSSLTSFPQLDSSQVNNFQAAWVNCSSLTSFPQLDSSQVNNFQSAWRDCSSLTEITNFGSWVITLATDMRDMLFGVTLNTANYDNTLIGWNSQRTDWTNLTDLEIDFGNSQYTLGSAAEIARSSIIANGATNLQDGGGV